MEALGDYCACCWPVMIQGECRGEKGGGRGGRGPVVGGMTAAIMG